MFTGLIEHVGSVLATESRPAGLRLRVDLGPVSQDLAPGDSVTVDGVCLTVSTLAGSQAEFDVVRETLRCSTLGEFAAGRPVNLERPITLEQRLGGHLVAGHVDGLATLVRWSPEQQSRVGQFQADAGILEAMIHRGSVAVNGVSLTVSELGDDCFSVALIPTTLAQTNLGRLRPGQKVNVETDLIGKYVARFLAKGRGSSISEEVLREHGFA